MNSFRHFAILLCPIAERGGIFVLFLIISYPLKSFRTNKIFILVFSPVAFPRKWELSSGELKKKEKRISSSIPSKNISFTEFVKIKIWNNAKLKYLQNKFIQREFFHSKSNIQRKKKNSKNIRLLLHNFFTS